MNPDQFLVYKVIAPTHAVVTDVLVSVMKIEIVEGVICGFVVLHL